jgi:hypothetical protein
MLSNQRTRAQGIPQIAQKGIAAMPQNAIRVADSLTAKLERTRLEVRRAQENVQASEGRLLDFDAAEAIQRAQACYHVAAHIQLAAERASH